MKKMTFFIGKTKFETTDTTLSVRQILVDYAKVDTSKNTLSLKEHGNFRELENLDEIITIQNGMHFVVFNEEPTPVS